MKRMMIGVSLLIALFFSIAGCSVHKTKDVIPEFVLTYADNQSEDYPTTLAAYKFAELVKERTEGKVIIDIKHSGEWGTQDDVISQMQFGGVDLARVSLSSISDELPRMNVLQLPFLYETEEQMWSLLDSKLGESFLNSLEQVGLVGLSWYEAGTRSFYSAYCAEKHYEVAKYYTVDEHARVPEIQKCKDMILPLYEKYCAAYMDLIEDIQNEDF